MNRIAIARTSSVALALLVLALGVVAAPASAGELRVATCQADQLNFGTSAFTGMFAARGMRIKRACNPEGSGMRGLITSNTVQSGRVARGAVAVATIDAPPGTRFTSLTWAGTVRRRDCGYAMQLYAWAADTKTVSIKNVRANQSCPHGKAPQATGYKSRTFKIDGATRIVQRVICEGTAGAKSCSARGSNYIRSYKAVVGVADAAPPTVEVATDTPLTQGAWVRGSQPLNYTANDNLGVLSAEVFIAGQSAGSQNRDCAMASPDGAFANGIPCPNGAGQINVDTTRIPDGPQLLAVQALDPAGNPGASPETEVHIDNTPPGRVDVAVEGGQEWRNSNDFGLMWTNPPEVNRAPIVAATIKLCPVGGDPSTCTTSEQAGTNISRVGLNLPRPGQWTATVSLRDAAGNQNDALASEPVTMRYDPEPPKLAFDPTPGEDPTLVSVPVTDDVSGLADGSIEISAEGSATWKSLDTKMDGSKLVTRIDDTSFPAGRYVLRAVAHDQAHNETSTTQRQDGQPMALTLPIRMGSKLTAGVVRQRTVTDTVKLKGGKTRKVRRDVTEVRLASGVRLGKPAQVVGQLVNPAGQGIPGAQVQVYSRSIVNPEHGVVTLTTDGEGKYAYSTAGTTNETLRFSYAGSSTILPSQTEVGLGVPAESTLKVDRDRVLNGATVKFTGNVRTLPILAGGKLVELQVYLSGRWQTFRTVRTDPAGQWAIDYQFKRTRGVQRFRFRAGLPKEAGYAFGVGTSPILTVRVRGTDG